MIINLHPTEIPSNIGKKIIAELLEKNPNQEVVNSYDKTPEQWIEIVKTDEPLILVTPVYWWGLGYEMDKWLQGVLARGFAFDYSENGPVGLLNGREFEVHLTHGTPMPMAQDLRKNIQERLEIGVFGFCNAKVKVNFIEVSKKM
jgi:putative NADPH-quinone reductase